jgi:hypothetical protein
MEHIINIENTDVLLVSDNDKVKVCTDNHSLGVAAEYKYIKMIYPEAKIIKQRFIRRLNIDILSIKFPTGEIKFIEFDISEMMNDLDRKASI